MIGVFFGSRSPEHDVSIVTGQLIISTLKKMGKPVVGIYIDKKGQWMLGEPLEKFKTFSANPSGTFPKEFSEYYLDLEKSLGKLVFRQKATFGAKTVEVDIAFPAFHGSNGEDGTIQGMFEFFNVPYVGCDVTSSAITMDKITTKLLLLYHGIPTPEFVYFTKREWQANKETYIKEIEKKLEYPVIVKPPHLGSSIGISKAKNREELEQGIEVVLHYDTHALIEQCINNLADLTISVLGDTVNPKASLIQESTFSKEFFSYEDKYLDDGGAQLGNAEKKLKIPADIDASLTEEMRELAVKVFQIIGCSGIARVDFLMDRKTNKYYVTEINTLPGTLYHHLWKKTGIELEEVLTTLIDVAHSRHKERAKLATTFESAILKQANSQKLQLKKG